jgi:type IV secretory pathway TrbD component
MQGTMFGGLPIRQFGVVLVSVVMGSFIMQGIFGLLGVFVWLVLHFLIYSGLSFLAKQDPMFITVLFFHLSAKFHPSLTCYEESQKNIEWQGEGE